MSCRGIIVSGIPDACLLNCCTNAFICQCTFDHTLTNESEDRFNHKFNYPYVFLNEQLFTTKFKS